VPLFAYTIQGLQPTALHASPTNPTIHEKEISNLNPLGDVITIHVLNPMQTKDHVACIFIDDMVQGKNGEYKGMLLPLYNIV
jgi:hypothetical protein